MGVVEPAGAAADPGACLMARGNPVRKLSQEQFPEWLAAVRDNLYNLTAAQAQLASREQAAAGPPPISSPGH